MIFSQYFRSEKMMILFCLPFNMQIFGSTDLLTSKAKIKMDMSIDKSSDDCFALTRYFEKKFGIPEGLLLAIATVESRQKPWAINYQARKSVYCKTIDDAVEYVSSVQEKTRNISIGYMQINWGVHKKNFVDLYVAFTPYYNIKFAAKLLHRLYKRYGSWDKAVCWYNPIQNGANYNYLSKIKSTLHKIKQAKDCSRQA